MREATAAFGVPAIELADWEADDLIASYARAAEAAGGRTTIVSSDKDLMQLIRPGVDMLDPIKQKPIGPAEVMEKFGVPPDKLVEVQALMGDCGGQRPRRARHRPEDRGPADRRIRRPGSGAGRRAGDEAVEAARRADRARRQGPASRAQLVQLRDDAPLPLPLDDLAVREPDRAELAAWLRRAGLPQHRCRGSAWTKPRRRPLRPRPPRAARARRPGRPARSPSARVADDGFGPYETVTTLEALHAWIAEATAAGAVAVDTETDGLDAMRAGLVGLSLATAPGRACYVPLRHADAWASRCRWPTRDRRAGAAARRPRAC